MRNDSRRTFRMQPPTGLDRGILRHRGRDIPVQLLDESAGGFAFIAAKTLRIAKGDITRVKTSAGWHEVQVVHQESTPDGFLIGVERLSDVTDPRDMAETMSSWSDYFFLPWQGNQKESQGMSLSTVGTGVALIAAVLLAANMLGEYKPPSKNSELIPGSREFVKSIKEGKISIVRRDAPSQP